MSEESDLVASFEWLHSHTDSELIVSSILDLQIQLLVLSLVERDLV